MSLGINQNRPGIGLEVGASEVGGDETVLLPVGAVRLF
jgi:hypothetical protein